MKQLQIFDDDFDPVYDEYDFGFEKDSLSPSEILQNTADLLCSIGLMVIPLVLPSTKLPVILGSFLFYRIKGHSVKGKVLLSGFFYDKVLDDSSGKTSLKFHFGNVLLASGVTIAASSIIYAFLCPQKRIFVKAKFLLPQVVYKFTPLLLSEEFPNYLRYIENCKSFPGSLLEIQSFTSYLSDSQKAVASDIFLKMQFNHIYLYQNSKWIFDQMEQNNTFFSECLLNKFGNELLLGMAVKKSPALGVFLATLS